MLDTSSDDDEVVAVAAPQAAAVPQPLLSLALGPLDAKSFIVKVQRPSSDNIAKLQECLECTLCVVARERRSKTIHVDTAQEKNLARDLLDVRDSVMTRNIPTSAASSSSVASAVSASPSPQAGPGTVVAPSPAVSRPMSAKEKLFFPKEGRYAPTGYDSSKVKKHLQNAHGIDIENWPVAEVDNVTGHPDTTKQQRVITIFQTYVVKEYNARKQLHVPAGGYETRWTMFDPGTAGAPTTYRDVAKKQTRIVTNARGVLGISGAPSSSSSSSSMAPTLDSARSAACEFAASADVPYRQAVALNELLAQCAAVSRANPKMTVQSIASAMMPHSADGARQAMRTTAEQFLQRSFAACRCTFVNVLMDGGSFGRGGTQGTRKFEAICGLAVGVDDYLLLDMACDHIDSTTDSLVTLLLRVIDKLVAAKGVPLLLVTDNANNMAKIPVVLQEQKKDFIRRIPCFSHTSALMAADIMDNDSVCIARHRKNRQDDALDDFDDETLSAVLDKLATALEKQGVRGIRKLAPTRWVYQWYKADDLFDAHAKMKAARADMTSFNGGAYQAVCFVRGALEPLANADKYFETNTTVLFGALHMVGYMMECYDDETFDTYIQRTYGTDVTVHNQKLKNFASMARGKIEQRFAAFFRVGPMLLLAVLLGVVREADYINKRHGAAFARLLASIRAMVDSPWALRIMTHMSNNQRAAVDVDAEWRVHMATINGQPKLTTMTAKQVERRLTAANAVSNLVYALLVHGACSEAACERTFSIANQIESLNMSEDALRDKTIVRVNNSKPAGRRRETRIDDDDNDDGEPPTIEESLKRVMPACAVFEESRGKHIVKLLRKMVEDTLEDMTQLIESDQQLQKRAEGRCGGCGKSKSIHQAQGTTKHCTSSKCTNFLAEACYIRHKSGDSVSFARDDYKCASCSTPPPVHLY